MEPNSEITETIEDIVANNCIWCSHLYEDIRTSPCLCNPMADVILQYSGIERQQEYVTEWERVQEQIQKLYATPVDLKTVKETEE